MKKNLFFFLIYFLTTSIVSGQESCTVMNAYEDGSYQVKIGNTNYHAITEEQMKKILNLKTDFKSAQEMITQKDTLIKSYEKTMVQYDSTLVRQRRYLLELESILDGYKNLLQDYKKLKEPWLTFEGGLGATGNEKKPAALLGISVRQISVLGLLQERNSGVMVSKAFKIF